jgi:hypothetical protein
MLDYRRKMNRASAAERRPPLPDGALPLNAWRSALENQLFYRRAIAQTEEHILKSEKHVARQRVIIADKQLRGTDCGLSRSLLATFEVLLVQHKVHRDNLLQSLAELSEP